jgi:MtN3 and saliva related transmembrane protein
MTDFIGYAAAILTTISFVPQAVMIIRTRNTSGISLTMYALFTVGVACWMIYGIAKRDIPMSAANVVTFTLAAIILFFKARDVWHASAK